MFGYNLNNMNMFGMNSMGFGNIGMFGFGGINMFGGMFGSSIFTNCNGSFNYDAYAGFQVGNVLMNIGAACAAQAIQSKRANSEKTLTQNVDNLSQRIADVEEEKKEYNKEKTTLSENKQAAETTKATLESQASVLRQNRISKEAALADAKSKLNADPQNSDLIAAVTVAEEELEAAKKAEEENKQKIEEQKKIIEDSNAAIEKLEGKINSCDNELDELNSKLAKIQEQLNNKALDKADGNKLNRTSIEEFNAKDFSKDETPATKQDMRRAIAEYRAASPEKKEELKEKIKLIYNKLSSEDKSNDIRQAYSIIFG